MRRRKRIRRPSQTSEDQNVKRTRDRKTPSHGDVDLRNPVSRKLAVNPGHILVLQQKLGNRFTRRLLNQDKSFKEDNHNKVQRQPNKELDPEWYKKSEWYKGQQNWRFERCMEGKGELGKSMKGDESGCREQVEKWTGKEYHKEKEKKKKPSSTPPEQDQSDPYENVEKLYELKNRRNELRIEKKKLTEKLKKLEFNMREGAKGAGMAPLSRNDKMADFFQKFFSVLAKLLIIAVDQTGHIGQGPSFGRKLT
jgi:hypothetical protein